MIDDSGRVNANGFPVTIGGGGGTPPPPTDNVPSISITSPTSSGSYSTAQTTMSLTGSASDDRGLSNVTWSNNRGGSGTATNSSGNWTSWSIPSVNLAAGVNVITVTAVDNASQTGTATLTVTSGTSATAWSAVSQIGDPAWKNSTAVRTVRLLVEGAHVVQGAPAIRLAFRGRTSGNYTIRNVSIAEHVAGTSDGSVTDATWTRVTFDGRSVSSWSSDAVTIPPGAEKLSDAVSFNLQPGKSYYVTFKIDSGPSYLNAPSSFRELYTDDDNSAVVDWSSLQFSRVQEYHAFSAIYAVTGGAPAAPTNVRISP